MTQHSEDRLEELPGRAPERASARILPFERPQSDLQRAIQERAQEALDIERDREREAKKPAPLRWLIILLIAMIPVILIFGAVDGFLRAFYAVNEIYQSAPPPEQPAVEEEITSQSATPGVIILQPYGERAAPAEVPPEANAAPAPPRGQ